MEEKGFKKISVRLDKATADKLDDIMNARGITQSDAIRLCIAGAKIIRIGDAKQLSQDFCKIRMMLEAQTNDPEIERKVDTLCRCIRELLLAEEKLPV